MALRSDAAMVLFYEIGGEWADHDDWHSYEHFHERLSVPGFLRATRWVTNGESPRYMVIYEVSGTDIATSPAYLERLNDPTAWTRSIMPRFQGMTRGFCNIIACAGFGLGASAIALRFEIRKETRQALVDWLSNDAMPAALALRGVTSAQLMEPLPQPPMTREQALRGQDTPLSWVLVVTGYDQDALEAAVTACLPIEELEKRGGEEARVTHYKLDYTADAEEVARTPKPPPLDPKGRKRHP